MKYEPTLCSQRRRNSIRPDPSAAATGGLGLRQLLPTVMSSAIAVDAVVVGGVARELLGSTVEVGAEAFVAAGEAGTSVETAMSDEQLAKKSAANDAMQPNQPARAMPTIVRRLGSANPSAALRAKHKRSRSGKARWACFSAT